MSGRTLRYELKIVCSEHELHCVRAWIMLHPEGFRRAHQTRRVNSLYFDTQSYDSLRANLDGASWRSKLRMRWYGSECERVIGQLELKRKRAELGDKRIHLLAQAIEMRQPWLKVRAAIEDGLPTSWMMLLQHVSTPTVIVGYEREYYVSRDGVVRATIDYSLSAFDQRLSSRPNLTRALPASSTVIVEVKAPAAETRRLEDVMAHFPARRIRNSKYANALLAALI